MRRPMVIVAAIVGATVAAAAVAVATSAQAEPAPSAAALVVARQTLALNDGWASSGTGTTGGSTADDAHVTVVQDRTQLASAVASDTPKIVLVNGLIDGNVDDGGGPLTCADYADPAYSLDAYLAAYDPAVWGRATRPTGPLEEARVRSARNQGARINIRVGANTTIVGLGGSKMVGVNLLIDRVDNVILRNLRFEDAYDCFPAWDPTDGALGNWNSLYDLVTVTGATHVWVDHCSFSDGNNTDDVQPVYFGRPYQVHDGALDVIRAADLVTVSYNSFFDHDKTMLIGSSNTVGADVGKLRVTIHHNRFANVGQRVPRVRFGQVDVYNNYFYATDEDSYSYSWGVGVFSEIYAENNMVLRSADLPLSAFVFDWRGTAPGAITEVGTLSRVGTGPVVPVSLVAEYNAAFDPDLPAGTWVPSLRAAPLHPTIAVQAVVTARAGAGKLGI